MRFHPLRDSRSTTLVVCCLLLGMLLPRAQAQIGGTLPRQTYYIAKRDYYAGSFRTAEREFLRSLKSGLRIGNRRWIDSICSYSMLGELYFRQGKLAAALQSHEAALGIFLANQDWMNRLRYPQILASNDRIQTRIGWGTRATAMGRFPDSMSSQEGTFDLQLSFQVGGPLNPAHMRSVDGVEVARCLAISLRRRALLLGPTTSISPLSAKLSQAVLRTSPPTQHWANAWVEVLYGLAQLNEGLRPEAVAHLTTGAVAGTFDHPLTGIALLEIGRYHLDKGEYAVAMNHLHQASLAAARFRQADIVQESLLLLTDAYLANGRRGVFPAIATVVPYAQREDFYRLTMSAHIATAEIAYYENRHPQSIALLGQAATMMARMRQFPTSLGARLNYVDALTAYRTGNRAAAWKSLQAAIAHRQLSSLQQFHLATIESLRAAGRRLIGPRELDILYSRILREPVEKDWLVRPLETMSWTLMDHSPSMANWFELLVNRKEYEKALTVAEQLKRHRFYRSLPMGGRLLALRWLFDGDARLLGNRFAKVQNQLRQSYPQMDQLTRQSFRIRAELQQLPLLPQDDEQRISQRKLFAELSKTASNQETIIHEIALRREPTPLVFPPQPSHSALQNSLKPHQGLLMFVTTSQGWHVWYMRKDSDDYWSIQKPKVVRNQITELLRAIGNQRGNSTLTDKDRESEDWKKIARALWKSMVGKLPSNGWDGLEELVIIPDGRLWYLPFELLQVPADQLADHDEDQMLADLARIRYAPLASMSLGDRIGHNADKATTIVGGALYPNESPDYAQEMLSQLKASHPNLTIIGSQKPAASSNLAVPRMNRLLVWNEVSLTSPYAWSPAQYDAKSSSSRLVEWMEYPWGGVDQILLPGMRTIAERSLSNSANGQEVFLSICGLMSTGTRTALLSRWRTGGRTPSVLVREFLTELTGQPASAAWQYATRVARNETLNTKNEPRVRIGSKTPEEISADHPFFWAGYLLVDTGAEPGQEPGQEPVQDDAAAPADPVPDEVPVEGQDEDPDEDPDGEVVDGDVVDDEVDEKKDGDPIKPGGTPDDEEPESKSEM